MAKKKPARPKRMKPWTGWCLVHKNDGRVHDGFVEDLRAVIEGDLQGTNDDVRPKLRIARVRVTELPPKRRAKR